MSEVFRAHDLVLDRDVALKMLGRGATLDGDARARLLSEARSAAALNHPHIVSVYDTGEDAGTTFVVMELVPGGSLRSAGAMSLAPIIDVARQLCAALAHAHAHGIIHRDVKPENILIAEDSDSPVVKLADLGIALSRRGARVTSEGAIVGTAHYLAPEQGLGEAIDGRADLYSLGVLLYELSTGRLPFAGDDPLAVVSQHLHAPVVPPRTYRADLPIELEAIILRLLAKRPENRFADALETASALAAVDPNAGAALDIPQAAGTVELLEQLARGRLVGRRTELKELRDLWRRVQKGNGHLALISGEPGVGKTRLAHELIVYAQLEGAVLLRGGCYEFEATTPYLPFVEAIRQWVRAQDAVEMRLRLGGTASELAKLAPEIEAKLGPLPPNPPLPPSEERLRLFDHLARFFQSLAAERGLIVFLDDLQWADHGTLALLHYLLRHLRSERFLVLGAYREAELDRRHPLSAAIDDWNRERLATRVRLGRLSLEETAGLLSTLFGQESVTADFAAAIHRETEGNPFFVEEVIKSLIELGQIYRERGEWQRKEVADLAIPQSIKATISRRLGRLGSACMETLQTAAALGKSFSFADLAAVEAEGEEAVLDALDEASAAQLISAESGERFVFTHDKIREVLYTELNPIRRRRLHQRIGQAIETLYAATPDQHVQDLAHHFIHAGELERGLPHALAAAAQAERVFAHEEALSFYELARESAESLKRTEERSLIHERMGDVHLWSGATLSAADQFATAMSLAATPARRAALECKIGSSYARTGDARGLAHLEAALQELDPATQIAERAVATAMVGRYHHYRAKHSLAIEFFERARELAEPLGHVETLTEIYAYLAGAYQHLARVSESMEWARRCIALGESSGNPMPMALGYEFLAEDALATGSWKEGLEWAQQDRRIGERIGSLDRVAWAENIRSSILYNRGELEAAAAGGRAAMALAERVGEMRLAALVGMSLGLIETDRGEEDIARSTIERGLEVAQKIGHSILQAQVRGAFGYWHLAREEWESALAQYEKCWSLRAETESRVWHLVYLAYHAETCLRLGRIDEAETVLAESMEIARSAGSRHSVAVGRRVEGQLLMARGSQGEAGAAFDEAVETLDELGSRLELGRALFYRGKFRAGGGDGDMGRADLERAREIFATAGAVRDAKRTEDALRSGGSD